MRFVWLWLTLAVFGLFGAPVAAQRRRAMV